MKNKKFTIGLVLLMAGSMAFTSCTKGKTNTAPEPDKETATASDMAMVELIASDMGEIAAQGLDGGMVIFAGNTVTPITSTQPFPNRVLTFSNTTGWDGRTRTGNFEFDENQSYPGATFYRNPGYVATATVTNYIVDNYTVNVNTFKIVNTSPNNWVIGQDLTWEHTYNFEVKKPDGTSITYDGTQTKLMSGYKFGTTASTVAVVQGTAATVNSIIWQRADSVKFYGKSTGLTATGQTYTKTVDKSKPLIRNYTCAPQKIVPASISTRNERHPFVKGIMLFKLPSKGDRTIDFGNYTCDYNVNITIDGITYQQDVD
jgi:hypothetical protein